MPHLDLQFPMANIQHCRIWSANIGNVSNSRPAPGSRK